MSNEPEIDWEAFQSARSELGAGFVRILGYFREDGAKSVAAIEVAIRNGRAAALVVPAHTLKGEARQFGAEALGDLAESIESFARHCVECHQSPEELLPEVVRLRPMFEATIAAFDAETNPLLEKAGSARRVEIVTNQGFGRI